MGLIYMRTSPSGGRYIGQTVFLEEKRWLEHCNEAKKISSPNYNCLINKAIRKYGGDNFSVIILEDGIENKEILNQREIYWIDYYKTYYLDNCHGYNMTRGGIGDVKFNSTTFWELWNNGKSFQEIGRICGCQPQTVSERLKAEGLTPEDILKRTSINAKIQNTTIGNYQSDIIKKYLSGMSQAAIAIQYNCNRKTIERILHNSNLPAEIFKERKSINSHNNRNSKPILQLDLNNNIIKEWPSISEAARYYKTSPSLISRACSGERQTSQNFKWRYKGE